MKALTFNHGKIEMGIALVADDKFGPVVLLGETGRGRRYEKVALARQYPPEVNAGKVYDAHPHRIPVKGTDRFFYILKRAEQPVGYIDTHVLIRVCTQWCYTRNTAGSWKTIAGSPYDVIKGYGAHGDAGRIGSWDDGLVIMSSGDVLYVKPEGGHKTKAYALVCNDTGVESMLFEDYQNMVALESESSEAL